MDGRRPVEAGDVYVEARARALACLGRLDEAAVADEQAIAVRIDDDDEDREILEILEGDLASKPWYGLIR